MTQKAAIWVNNLGILDQKKEIIYNMTDGRTTSSKELYMEEARRLLINLSEYDPKERLKSLVFSLAYRSGIIYGSTADDKKMNTAKLNLFIKERGTVKKSLNEMNYQELIKTHRQFEGIVRNVEKSKDNKKANTLVAGLLEELNLNIS